MEKIAFFSLSALCQCGGELLFCPPDGFLHGVRLHVEHPGDFVGGVALPKTEQQHIPVPWRELGQSLVHTQPFGMNPRRLHTADVCRFAAPPTPVEVDGPMLGSECDVCPGGRGINIPQPVHVEYQVQEGLLYGVLGVGGILQYLHGDVAHQVPVFDVKLLSLQFLFF